MGRVLICSFAIIVSLACAACQDDRSELEKTMFPDGTPPGITFEEATDEPALDDSPPNDHGKRFLQELVDAAEESDQVVAVEHSYIYDGPDPSIPLLPERSYKRVVLSNTEKSSLVSALRSTNPNVEPWESACIFEPHHRLEFYKGSKKLRVLEVCFQCGQLELDGSTPSEPQAIFDSLEKFVIGIGMEPERDWGSLADTDP